MQSSQQPKSNGSPKYNASLPQLTQPPRTEAARRPGRRVVPETLKTEMCRALFLTGSCNFEDDCKFFHDPKEAQPRKMDGKFKTVSCSSFSQTGKCKFSDRCSFLHDEQSVTLESGLRKLVYQEAGLVREEIEENLWQWKWIKEPQPKTVTQASVSVPVQQPQVPIQQGPMVQPQIQQPRVVSQPHPQPLPQPMSHPTAPILSTMTMAGLPLPMTSGSMPTQAAPVDVQVPGANWRVVFVPQLVNTQSENSFSSSTVQQMLAQVVHQQQQLQQQQNQIQQQQQQLQHQMAMAHLSMTMAQMSGATMGMPSAGLVNMHMTTASAGSLQSSVPTQQGQVGVHGAEMQSSTQFTSDLAEDMPFSGEDESAAGSGSQSQSGTNSTVTSGVSSGTSTKRDDLSLSRERTLSHNENSTQTEEEQFNLAVSELADRLRDMFEKPGFLLPPDEPKSQPFTAVAGLVVPAASDPATRIRTC